MTKLRKLFYVVRFIELPFEGINDNVCVPNTWIIVRSKYEEGKVVVTYPNNEDPSKTRERVRNKELPNDEWRFYLAYLKDESNDFEDGLRIARNEFRPDEEKIKNTEPEPCLSETNADKPQDKLKPYRVPLSNPRKPLPRISIRRPLSQKPDQNLNNKCLKLNKNAKPGILTDHITAASGSSKREQSIIITGNQVIQKHQTKTNYASNGEMNTEKSTQPEVIMENQAVDLSV